MKRPVSALVGRHRGETVYVLASGATVAFFPPGFFARVTVIGINDVYMEFPCTYVVTHHPECCQPILNNGQTLVTSAYAHGEHKPQYRREYIGDYYEYQTYATNRTGPIDLRPILDDDFERLVISYNTVSEGINLAYLMGAAAIMLCGVDGGTLDGHINYHGYNRGEQTRAEDIRATHHVLVDVVRAVRAKGVAVVTCLPFLDLTLEGHVYESLVADTLCS